MKTLALLLAPLLASSALAADKAGCKDHPLVPNRMPGYSIQECKSEEFGVFQFESTSRGKRPSYEGRTTVIRYRVDDRKQEPSPAAVVRNYENAITQAGGTVLDHSAFWTIGKLSSGGRDAWIQAMKGNGLIWLRVVEKEAMKQYVQADAAAMSSGLAATGHVALYGIFFDTGSAVVKPESRPALEEIAKLLASAPALKLEVVGHTDMTGGLDANMKLSQVRAESVVKALTTDHGVAATRLRAFGVGPLAPVATNDSDDGRAKNRRVELVKE
jgi:outer membrane protein OmpA-like peptidoglycan-associated protein